MRYPGPGTAPPGLLEIAPDESRDLESGALQGRYVHPGAEAGANDDGPHSANLSIRTLFSNIDVRIETNKKRTEHLGSMWEVRERTAARTAPHGEIHRH